jgi:voltage-gated potassium channel
VLHSLSDGVVDEAEREHLEMLRVELGLSHAEANQAIKIMSSQRAHALYCKHCGNKL